MAAYLLYSCQTLLRNQIRRGLRKTGTGAERKGETIVKGKKIGKAKKLKEKTLRGSQTETHTNLTTEGPE